MSGARTPAEAGLKGQRFMLGEGDEVLVCPGCRRQIATGAFVHFVTRGPGEPQMFRHAECRQPKPHRLNRPLL